MRGNQTNFVEVIHLRFKFFIECFISLIFIVINNLMLASVSIVTYIIKLFVLNILIFVIRLNRL